MASKSPAPKKAAAIAEQRKMPNSGAGMRSIYRPMFEKIDADKSGYIDASELLSAITKLFPESRFTGADIASMISEADCNADGVISLEEFTDIMVAAEGKSTLWGMAQKSMWATFSMNMQQTSAVIHTAARPLKLMARQHSYESADGKKIASVGLRMMTSIVGSLVALSIGVALSPIPPISIAASIFMFFFNLVLYCNGQTFDMWLCGLQMVDAENGKPFNFFYFFIAQFLFTILFFFEFFVFPCTGKSLSQRIMGGEIIVLH